MPNGPRRQRSQRADSRSRRHARSTCCSSARRNSTASWRCASSTATRCSQTTHQRRSSRRARPTRERLTSRCSGGCSPTPRPTTSRPACQVAHAISTHRVSPDFDYYTAVDDLRPEETQGADMIGTVAFNAACYYRYAALDVEQLTANLDGDSDARALRRARVHRRVRARGPVRQAGHVRRAQPPVGGARGGARARLLVARERVPETRRTDRRASTSSRRPPKRSTAIGRLSQPPTMSQQTPRSRC